MAINKASAVVVIALLLAACAATSGPSARGYELRIRYAQVTAIDRVKLPANAPAGAVVGGFTGPILASNRSWGRQLASGIGGAALGALAEADGASCRRCQRALS